jgi:hypothetical protein
VTRVLPVVIFALLLLFIETGCDRPSGRVTLVYRIMAPDDSSKSITMVTSETTNIPAFNDSLQQLINFEKVKIDGETLSDGSLELYKAVRITLYNVNNRPSDFDARDEMDMRIIKLLKANIVNNYDFHTYLIGYVEETNGEIYHRSAIKQISYNFNMK